jgi:predicted Zn-ribbon and HTH transcriptional regulator
MLTPRQQILERLEKGRQTVRTLSRELRLPEKDIVRHLEHLARSLVSSRRRLAMEPPVCMSCGFSFRKRERMSAPSRCPLCKSEHISDPVFFIED